MKKDRVLRIDEYLNEIRLVPKHVNPPTPGARHISMTVEENPDAGATEQRCRCDRWGHPCDGCQIHAVQKHPVALPIFIRKKQTR